MTTSSSEDIGRDLESMRCRECRRLLLRVQHRALRPGHVLEVLCRCHTMNFLIGAPST
jgi:phage FluMu protein Com